MSDVQLHLQKLTKINKGDDHRTVARSDRMNAIQELLKSVVRGDHIVTNRSDIRKRTSSGLTGLSIRPNRNIIGGHDPFPWEITVADRLNFGLSIKVNPGSINGILPSNMFTLFPIPGLGTFFVNLDCTTDGKSVTNAFLDVSSSPPNPIESDLNLAPSNFTLSIGVVVDKAVFQVVDTNIEALPTVTVQTLRGSPAPGEPFWDYNYTWQITYS